MKLTIFTGISNEKPFFDTFVNDEGYTPGEYVQDIRFDFELSDEEIETKAEDKAADFETFQGCLKGVYKGDLDRFIHKAFVNELQRELINDAIDSQLRQIVVDEWIADCLIAVKSKCGDVK